MIKLLILLLATLSLSSCISDIRVRAQSKPTQMLDSRELEQKILSLISTEEETNEKPSDMENEVIQFGSPVGEEEYFWTPEFHREFVDKKVLERLENIYTLLFPESEDKSHPITDEQLAQLIKEASEIIASNPDLYNEDEDDGNYYRHRLVIELKELTNDLGCDPSDLEYRSSVGDLVGDNRQLRSFVYKENLHQFDICRKELEAKMVEVIGDRGPGERDAALNELSQLINGNTGHAVPELSNNEVLEANYNHVIKTMRSKAGHRIEAPRPNLKTIATQLDILLEKECMVVTSNLYDLYDDFTVLNDLSERATGVNQWELLKPEVHAWIEAVKACMPIRGLDVKSLYDDE